MPEISAEKITYVIAKARELASGADGSKRASVGVVSMTGQDGCAAARAELAKFIEAMDENEQSELIALCWIGRGKFTLEDWDSALVEAHHHLTQPTADYLLRDGRLAPHLESGLAEFAETGDGFGRAQR
jgi:hypothetical protein